MTTNAQTVHATVMPHVSIPMATLLAPAMQDMSEMGLPVLVSTLITQKQYNWSF